MDNFSSLIRDSESWLVQQSISYAKEHNYLKYITNLESAWHASIVKLNKLIITAWETNNVKLLEFSLNEDFSKCPIACFAVEEARKHRKRGVNLGMFLGMLKYFRRSYLDLVTKSDLERKFEKLHAYFLARFFDRIEISITSEWSETKDKDLVVELQNTNREITQEKLKLLTVFENLPTPVILFKENNEIDFLNHSASQFFPNQQNLYSWLREELDNFKMGSSLSQSFDKTLKRGKICLHFNVKIKRILDLSSNHNATVVILNDVTTMIKSQEILKENEELFRSYFENAAVGTALVSPSGQYLRVNQSMCRMVGYSEREMLSMTFRSVTHPEDIKESADNFLKLLNSERKRCHFQKRYCHKRGFTIWAQMNISLVRDLNNVPTYFVVQAKDITREKWAEEALKGSLAKFRMLFNKVNDLIALRELQADGLPSKFLEVNDVACEKLGYSREELLKIKPTDLMTDESIPLLQAKAKEYLKKGTFTAELTYVTKAGNLLPLEFNSHIFELNGKKVSLAIARDIRERKELEQELLRSSKLESISLLAGGIAHDFNNFLAIILGNISLFRMKYSTSTEAADRLKAIEDATLDAKSLTQQLLSFSKNETPDKQLVAIGDMVKDTLTLALSGSNSTYETFFASDLCLVAVNKGQINQVLNNLFINALQAMVKGGTIRVKAENVNLDDEEIINLKKGTYVKISIEDEGSGIPAENLEKVFDPYFTTKETGSGLGLTSCYSIIKKHGGHIVVKSELGNGTTFEIYLPALETTLMQI